MSIKPGCGLAGISASFLLPTVTADPSYTRTHTSANQASTLTGKPTNSSATFNNWQVPFDLAYEVDVWGRVRRTVEASNAPAAATADDLAVVQLTVASDVATFYFRGSRSLDDQEQILEENVAAFAEQVQVVSFGPVEKTVLSVRLTRRPRPRLSTKRPAPSSCVTCSGLARTRSTHWQSSAGVRRRRFRSRPTRWRRTRRHKCPPVCPARLLTRRPDVAEAEQNVVSLNAQVGVATAEFYPTFTLTGTAGFESASFDHILDWKSKIASIGPSISMPIFEAGRLNYNLTAAKAQYQQTVAAYVNQVLIAYGDVEDALTDLHALADEVDRMRAAVDASQNYVTTARAQYKQGLVNYLIVTDAERTLLANQLTLSQDVNSQMAASVHLIKALGGGWQSEISE